MTKVENERAPCGCWKRQPYTNPLTVDMLPFNINHAEASETKDWIEDFYAASAFNKCTHQKLPGA